MALVGAPDEARRVLIVAPGGRDADVIAQLLKSASVEAATEDGTGLCDAILCGSAAAGVLTDDGLARIDPTRLRAAVEGQPPWSDFPVVLLARRGETREGSRDVEDLLNLTVLERPLHPANLVSAVRAALRGRMRQRLAADFLAEREAAEVRLRELADTLEQKVAERTAELASANERLLAEIAEREKAEARLLQAQKMEAIGQLTGGIAHDFNNLLTAVIGSLDLLLRRTEEDGSKRLASNALQAAERGARLTAQLLAFSRRQRLSPVAVDPNRVISGMGDLIARAIGPHIRIETRLDPHLWPALADPTQLEVMLLNLVINARDAMPSGGRVTIETGNVAPVPAALAGELLPGEYVSIAVADDGCGMPPDVLARAFEPFFTTKALGKGTGLGLAQLYGFARQSGGTARIDSAPGEGARVSIYLPRSAEMPTDVAATAMASRPAQSGRILVVDDDDDVRAVASAMIAELGYDVDGARSGEEGLGKLAAAAYRLVVTDLAMPGMNGLQFARRARVLAPAVPILFASGYADVRSFGEELNEERVLKKPYRIADIAARIHDALADAGGAATVVPFRRG